MSWSTAKPNTGGSDIRLEDLFELITFNKGSPNTGRFVGPITSYAEHWMDVRKKDGGKASISKHCLNYNPKTQEFEDNGCPYCKTEGVKPARVMYLSNIIDRELQDSEPMNKPPLKSSEKKLKTIGFEGETFDCYVKESVKSKSWTPVVVLRATPTVTKSIQTITASNKRKTKKGEQVFELSHPKFGRDIEITYDPNLAGAAKYNVQKGENREPLSDEELNFLLWDIFKVDSMVEDLATAERNVKQLSKIIIGGKEEENKKKFYSDEDEDEDEKPRKKKSKNNRSSKDLEDDDIYEEGDDDSIDVDIDDDEEKPRKKKSANISSRRRKSRR